ncbi:hypothetical protein AYR62_01770 [Secundilactobacillus paracollinoides]|uniref:Ig-like domain-containing protein n=1 Tax=Secundilactobacillus paracollinoides TaxID=240427 RepID=UPI00081A941D|nr:Ig-like domain-containing protein [Secundilactobacillus paracollinoides]ANZ62955.1 hypothetical protein AYR62_01770 [Secundilactobacillus paracollinoides]
MGKGSKNLSKHNRQLATMNENEMLHYRMYKSGKTWLFASIATVSLGLVFIGAPNAHADTTPATVTTTSTATQSTGETGTTATTTDTTTTSTEATATGDNDGVLVDPTQEETQQAKADAVANGSNQVAAVAADTTVADDQAEVTKSTTAIDASQTVAADPALENGDTAGDQTGDSGTTTDPNTSNAVFKNSFGPTAGTADNSGTAGLGEVDDDDNLPAVTQANADTDREAGEYGTIPVTEESNDNLDEDIVVDKQSTSTTALDDINDQGAVSTDAENLQQRGTVIYANGQNKEISISTGGSNEHGTTISLPQNIADTATVGTFTVITQNPVGLTIQDVATHEEFQITDPEIAAQYKVGDTITGQAVVDTNFNGSGMELVTTPVTTFINGISDLFEGAGATALEALKTAVSAARLIPLAPTDAINAYTQGIDEEVAEIESMIDSGQNLMQNGVTQTTLEDAISDNNGNYEIMSSDGVATSITNMVDSYIQGWTAEISNGILSAVGAKDNDDGTNALDDLGLAGSAIKLAAQTFATAITTPIDALSSAATSGIGDAITQAIDGGVGVSQTVALPIEYTDPDLSENTPGAFTGETIKTSTKLYNVSTASNTTLVYQNVDKTQLEDAIANAASSDPNLAAAQEVQADPNASQQDVDKAYLALDPQGQLNVTITNGTEVVGHIAATPITGTTGQTAQEALDANTDKAFTTDVDGLTVTLTSGDFDYSDATTDADGNSVTTYTLNTEGQAKVKSAVTALGSNYAVTGLDAVASTITISADTTTPTDTDTDTPEITDPSITGNSTDGYDFTGTTDPNTPVTLTDPDGKDLGTGNSDGEGNIDIPITGTVKPGEEVTATPEDGTPTTAKVPDDQTTPTDTDTDTDKPEINDPSIIGNSTDGYDFTGTTDPNTPVTLTDPEGKDLGTGNSDDDGNIDIPITGTVTPGEEVTATPEDGTPTTAKVPDDPTTPTDTDTDTDKPEITDPSITGNSTDGYDFTGTTDPNTPVTLTDPDGKDLGTGNSDGNGNIDIPITGTVTPGEEVTATPEDGTSTTAIVPDDPTTPTDTDTDTDKPEINDPSITGNSTDGYDFTGTTDPNTPVTLTDPNGNDLGSGNSDGKGNIDIPITGTVTPGEEVTATPEDGTPTTAEVPDDLTTPTDTDTDTPEITDAGITGNSTDGYSVTGKSAPNTPITVKGQDGVPVATGATDGSGTFTIPVDPKDVDPGEAITVTPEGGDPVDLTVPTDATITGDSTDGYTITGKSAPNTPITVKNQNGDPIATGTSDGTGTFTIPVDPKDVDPGDPITVTPEGGDPVDLKVPTDTDVPVITEVGITGDPTNGYTITGKSAPNAPITVKNQNGDPIATGTTDGTGTFTIPVDPGDVDPGDPITVTPEGGDPVDLKVPTDTDVPVITEIGITGDPTTGYTITGKSAPNTPITVKDKNGDPIATGETDGTGTFTIPVDPGDVDPGDPITVTPKDGDPTKLTVPDGDKPVIQTPNITGNSTDGYDFTGKTDPKTPVTLTDPSGKVIGTGTSDENCHFDIPINAKDVTPNEEITATPDGGDPATANVPSDPTIDNPQVTGNEDNGYQVTGKSAPNTPITIYDKTGNPIAHGETTGSGTFTIPVSATDVDPGDPITIEPEGGDQVTAKVPGDGGNGGTTGTITGGNGSATNTTGGNNGSATSQTPTGTTGQTDTNTTPADTGNTGIDTSNAGDTTGTDSGATTGTDVSGNGGNGLVETAAGDTTGQSANGAQTSNAQLGTTGTMAANTGNADAASTGTANTANQLPQTDEAENNLAILGLLGAILSFFGLAGTKKRRN